MAPTDQLSYDRAMLAP